MDLDRTIVITGASEEIGASLVGTFLERGYNVVAASSEIGRSAGNLQSDRLACVAGDIADPDTAEIVAKTAVARFGRIDALINGAGTFVTKPFIDYTVEDYRHLVSTNLDGFLHLTQLVVRQMLAQGTGGSIVTITSPRGDQASPGVNASVAIITSSGVEAASKTIAMEHARDGIRVNIVAPGVVVMPPRTANQEILLETLPATRSTSMTKELIDAVVFLTEAPQITGKVLHVDCEPVDRW
ncbi:NAD(P)-dependent dehydrogenase (short-subunit alcohol dehydrogenase family) [Inquilinus ginsengisoli]|uniref:SDR family NAD(P)-dependent oxidoreductase n=1 Tax=Inquilinus ginsengisoli TaxID=363840 RepID=UPI003D19B03C